MTYNPTDSDDNRCGRCGKTGLEVHLPTGLAVCRKCGWSKHDNAMAPNIRPGASMNEGLELTMMHLRRRREAAEREAARVREMKQYEAARHYEDDRRDDDGLVSDAS